MFTVFAPFASARTKVTIALTGGEALFPEQIRTWFEEEYPQYEVEWMLPPWGFVREVPVLAAGGVAPDAWYGEAGYAMEWGFNGMTEDLGPYIARDLSPDEYYLLDAVRDPAGPVWGVPGDFQVTVTFYRPSLFDQAGLAYPEPDWTLDDMLSMAEKLKRIQGDQVVQYGLAGHWASISVGWFFWTKLLGGHVLDETRTRSLLNSRETVAALEEMRSWIFERNIIPKPGEGNYTFLRGNLAMENYIYVRVTNARDAGFTDYDVQLTPAGPGGRRFTTVVPNVWVMNAASSPERKEAAWDWIKFALSPKVQAFRALQGFGVPVNREAGLEFLQMAPIPKNRIAFLESFAFAQTLDENAVWGIWALGGDSVYEQFLRTIFEGTESVPGAVEKAHHHLSVILESAFGSRN